MTILLLGGLVSGFAFVPFVEAGFFSFLDKIFGFNNSEESLPALILNSQTAQLLEAVLNPNPVVGVGGGEINTSQGALISDVGVMGSIADIEQQIAGSDRISIYVVREGDNLSQIAEMFNVSVNTIIWANDIQRGDLIKVGEVLVILPVTGIRYTVKKGDTLVSIAKKYKGDIDEIIAFNDLLEDEVLVLGEEIIIPDGEALYKPAPVYVSGRTRGFGGPNYVGYYARPITGGTKSQSIHGYNGIDLATYCGAPVLAAATGDVIVSRDYGWNGGYGKYIVISHPNGTQTLYAHNSKNIVTRGWHVVKGQVIGYIGSTGKSTGCHVHFEVRGARNPF